MHTLIIIIIINIYLFIQRKRERERESPTMNRRGSKKALPKSAPIFFIHTYIHIQGCQALQKKSLDPGLSEQDGLRCMKAHRSWGQNSFSSEDCTGVDLDAPWELGKSA